MKVVELNPATNVINLSQTAVSYLNWIININIFRDYCYKDTGG